MDADEGCAHIRVNNVWPRRRIEYTLEPAGYLVENKLVYLIGKTVARLQSEARNNCVAIGLNSHSSAPKRKEPTAFTVGSYYVGNDLLSHKNNLQYHRLCGA